MVSDGSGRAVKHVVNIVMVTGFESFNIALYKQVCCITCDLAALYFFVTWLHCSFLNATC